MTKRKYCLASIFTISFLIFTWFYIFPIVIEHEFKKRAEEKNFEVKTGKISLSLSNIVINDVALISHDKSINGTISHIDIGYGFDLSIEHVKINGGEINILKSIYEFEKIDNEKNDKRESISKSIHDININWINPVGQNSNAKLTGFNYENGVMYVNSILAFKDDKKIELDSVSIIKNDKEVIIDSKNTTVFISSFGKRKITSDLISERSLNNKFPRIKFFSEFSSIEIIKKKFEFKKLKIEAPSFDSIKINADSISYNKRMYGNDLRILGKIDGWKMNGNISLSSLTMNEERITDGEIKTGKVGFNGFLNKNKMIGDISLENTMANVEISFDNEVILFHMNIDKTKCDNISKSIPREMIKTVEPGLKMEGYVSMNIKLEIPVKNKEKTSVKLKIGNDCKVLSLPKDINVEKLRKPFKMIVYDEKKNSIEMTVGPGTKNWTPLMLMSKYVPISFKTTEDPGFMKHDGFHVEAIENSIKLNIIDGKFTRGASTITMQLAKNLWLNRKKLFSRKIEEAILTIYLEQELSKERILELYLNIIEFGPNIYGIGNASKHYFNTHPVNLSLSQSLFLASLLPNPLKNGYQYKKEINQWKVSWLHRVMKAMRDRKVISDDEYDEAIREKLVYGVSSSESEEVAITDGGIGNGIGPDDWEAD